MNRPATSGINPLTWTGLAVAAGICLLVFLTTEDYGLTWDEPEYMRAGAAYVEWLKHPTPDAIESYWRLNHEHPPLIKLLGGLSMELFDRRLNALNATRAFRLPILIFVFTLAFSLFRHGAGRYGPWIGLYICGGFFLTPRIFFHAHIGAMDFPIAALWFMTVLALNEAVTDSRWRYAAGVLLGIALLVKIHGVFLCFPAALALVMHLRRKDDGAGALRRAVRWAWPLLTIPLILFYAGWPWLWEAPFRHAADYIAFHIRHGHTPVFYFGEQHLDAPWHLPPVLFFAVLPLTILVPFLVGLLFPVRRSSDHILMLFSLAASIGLIVMSPGKHDGVRLFLPAFAFACAIAGAGLDRIRSYLKTPTLRNGFTAALLLLFAVEVAGPTIRYHPYQTAYFNPLVGGVRGALRHGLEFHYWCESYKDLLPRMDRHPHASFWVPVAPHLFHAYYSLGVLRNPPRLVDGREADYLILPARPGMFDDLLWEYYRNHEPVFAVRRMGVVLAGVYSLKRGPGKEKGLMSEGVP